MSARAHLLYFDGCPNVNKTRENLKLALAQAGFKADGWDEVNLEDPRTPNSWRGFPSPTVLINGRDVVTGARSASGTSACRFGGAPSTELIRAKLAPKGMGRWLTTLAAIPAAAIGIFSVASCPACYPALAGLLSAVGLGTLVNDAILKPLTIALLLVALSGLAYQAKRAGRYFPAVLGSLGAVGMYAGLYSAPSALLKWSGIAALIGASIWNLAPRKSSGNLGGLPCPACNEAGKR